VNPKAFWGLLRASASEWVEDKAPRLGAALAYYTVFSIAPLLLIAIAVAGMVFDKAAAQGKIVDQIRNMVGKQGAEAIEAMIKEASKAEAGYTATAIGVVLLLVGATALFGQLQDAMNTIWEVQPKPGRGVMGFLKDRFLSFGMVMGTVFLLLVSLIASAALAAVVGPLRRPGGQRDRAGDHLRRLLRRHHRAVRDDLPLPARRQGRLAGRLARRRPDGAAVHHRQDGDRAVPRP
jgi:membrane protein